MKIEDLKIGELYHFKYQHWDMLCRYESGGNFKGIYRFTVFSATKDSLWKLDRELSLNTSLVTNNLELL